MDAATQALVDAALRKARNPYELPLPDWFEQYRDPQLEAIDAIMAAYKRGVRMVVLDAPTGSGKTLIGETVRQLLGGMAAYVCSDKSLQEQFARDYPYASLVKGRSNYPTMRQDLYVTAGDCTWTKERPCNWCTNKRLCPYELAKTAALDNNLAILNTSYFLTEGNGPGKFRGRGLAIMDEADTLENVVMNHVGVEVGRRRVSELGLGEPAKVTKEDSWLTWTDTALEIVKEAIPDISKTQDVRVIRNWNYLTGLLDNLRMVRKSMEAGGWIYTGKAGMVSFKPVRVHDVGPKLVWPLANRWLLMSATVISAEELLGSLGWSEPYELVTMQSSFPVENRRIKIVSCADMSKKANEREKLADGIRRVLDRHSDDRVLMHTVSYDLAGYVEEVVRRAGRPTYTYSQAAGRDAALAGFKRSKAGVLIASSMGRGVDLPDDLCRVVVVCKVPFPYLGDRQVSARLHAPGGNTWYTVQTVRSLVQMTGRATRHSTDFSTVFVLDSQFEKGVWSRGRALFPQWWRDALDWRDRLTD